MRHRVTRRHVLAAAAAGVAMRLCGRRAHAALAVPAGGKLAAFDELMARFMLEHKPPGAALAITHRGRLVYARGFGFADLEAREPIEPTSLFRIASLSKPFTAAAVMRLVEAGKMSLDDHVFDRLKLEPHLEAGDKLDPRWRDITVRHCLQHTGGWDRGKSFDPMAAVTAEDVSRALQVPLPISAMHIIRYTLGKPLDFDPGTAHAYSNFGYCVLGRVIEAVSGRPYHELVSGEVLAPVGIQRMRLGKNLLEDRASGEVKYYDSGKRTGRAISGPRIGARVPLPYGVECIETMDANGGWIASAVDLMRFAAALEDPQKCPVLKEATIEAMLAPPPGPVGHEPDGRPKQSYYACGWNVRRSAGGPGDRRTGNYEKSHSGLLAGSSTMLTCGADGIDWAALFNCDAKKGGKQFAGLIDPLVRRAAATIKEWPDDDLFKNAGASEPAGR